MDLRGLLLASAILLVSGCMSMKVVDPVDDESSMIIGYINVKDLNGSLSLVGFMQHPPVIKAYLGMPRDIDLHCYDDGLFIGENVKPGDYFLYAFSIGNAVFQVVNNPADAKPFTIRKKEIYFWGSLDVNVKEASFVEKMFTNSGGTFSLAMSAIPNRKQVMQMAIERAESKAWEDRIRAEMNK
jgi:hypothetical protein